MKEFKHIFLVTVVGIAILAQLMNPTRVHADGETTPQPSETPVEASTSVPTEAPTEALVTETATPEPVVTDPVTPTTEAAETSTPVPPENPTEATATPIEPAVSAPKDASVSDALQQLPGKNKVVVLDKFNRPLPLASQAAADTIAISDPMWCPAGQLPVPGVNGCTPNFFTLSDLINFAGFYINSFSVGGTIWITQGSVADFTPVTLDGSIYTNWANQDLTMQGGWSGISGDTTIGTNSVFSVPITIANWNGNLSINNIDVDASASGLNINNASGDIAINNSSFRGNNDNGVALINVGRVTINNSHFDQNASNGVNIYNVQNVFINNSSFNQNSGQGAAIVGAGNIDISGSTFNDNLYHGIYVASTTGSVTLANITATANPGTYGDGAYIDNTGGTGNVTLTGTNDFSNHHPWNSGMYILSNGNVSLSGITSNNNGRGVNISQAGSVNISGGTFFNNVCNCEGSGVYAISAGDVSIDQSNFYGNTLYISSSNGNVNVDHVNIDRASGFGLGVQTGGGSVTITNSSVTNTVADSNNPMFPWGDGADIFTNGGNLTVTGSQFNSNAFDGLYAVVNNGNILVENSHFNNNQIGGLDVASANQIDVRTSEFTANGPYYDLFASCYTSIPPNFYNYLSLIFPDEIGALSPTFVDILVDNNCTYLDSNYSVTVFSPTGPVVSHEPPQVGRERKAKPRLSDSGHSNALAESHVELFLCWDNQITHKINLPNGDKVEIICPVRGKASISRLDNTTLPADLPDGYTFASAFQVDITQPDFGAGPDQRKAIDVITQGGYIKASFVASALETGGIYSILYWDPDTNSWIPLKDFIRDPGGAPHVFSLHSEDPADPKKILSGVNFLSRILPQRVEVSTNFPGIFVLALR